MNEVRNIWTEGTSGAVRKLVNNEAGPNVTIVADSEIMKTLDDGVLQQAMNCARVPGVSRVALTPDAHFGYGSPVGCVMASPTHIYPGPVGVDIKCSMSLLALDLEAEAVEDRSTRRALIEAICDRIPTGAGYRKAKKGRTVSKDTGEWLLCHGAEESVLKQLGIPAHWAEACEDHRHGSSYELFERLYVLKKDQKFYERLPKKMGQLGSLGGGNHFAECERVCVPEFDERANATAAHFGLRNGQVAFLTHCGSRGIGHTLAEQQFRLLRERFELWNTPLPSGERELVYAPLGTQEADDYLCDMAMAGNFATVNHLLINALVLEAFQEVIPGTTGDLVYYISHNMAREEVVDNRLQWVHRKGATRAFPAGHHALKGTKFESTGHPILLPGDPQAGSAVMVAERGAEITCHSVNHGAGRIMGRKQAKRKLCQVAVNESFDSADVLHNGRDYPIDEAPGAYKDFNKVLRCVRDAGLAREVARLRARFVIKDAGKADD